MDEIKISEIKDKHVEELCDLLEQAIKGQHDIEDVYLRAAKLDERYVIFNKNENLIRIAMNLKIGV